MSNYTNTFGGAAKDAAESIIQGTDFDTEFDNIATMSGTKANKTVPASTNNVATLSASGDLQDGGYQPTTFAKTVLDDADAGAVKDTLLLSTSVTITPPSDADVTLSSTQATYGRFILVDGSWTSAHNIIVPTNQRCYFVDNSAGTYTATVKTSAGTGIAVAAGTSRPLVCDGTNVVDPLTAYYTKAQADALKITGDVVQVVYTQSSSVATGTNLIPQDDTIPQSTEGDQYMTLSITPQYASSKLLIEAMVFLSHTATNGHKHVALFRDSASDAIAVSSTFESNGTEVSTLHISAVVDAGSTVATTFKIRAGSPSAGTTTFNGQSGARLFGVAYKSNMKITEIKG